ncbi:hypothetical protein FYJ28_06155 [Arthrobacter sp. BL-252-APC-1A]|uniref:hypothetical protein n=1 Tax=Arthrobacter sp. BL-252-APC-1A TaxID=2606622 RepID=UPI0012B28FD8|nr:hypothetical protein [Arthrobacter sp. BL-252-APC-1A]MSR98407.1 hypothetical protein [Arthrobacter sp. BL-252-APC-1A]
MSKPKNGAARTAGALAVALGVSAASMLAGCGVQEPEPYRTVLPAPSPAVSVPATVQAQAPAQQYVPVPAPTPESETPDPGLESNAGDPADSGMPGSGESGAVPPAPAPAQIQIPAPAPTPTPEQLELAGRVVWDPSERDRAAAALAEADAYTAAHPDTAEAAVFSSIRRDLACGSGENGTALVTRALRAAGYTFSGLAPQDIVSWFAAHPGSGTLVRDPGAARPGSVLLTTGACGTQTLGVYLADGLAVFAGADVPASAGFTAFGTARIAPVDQLPPGVPALPADPVYVRVAPYV